VATRRLLSYPKGQVFLGPRVMVRVSQFAKDLTMQDLLFSSQNSYALKYRYAVSIRSICIDLWTAICI
jgi:hypothetical protein